MAGEDEFPERDKELSTDKKILEHLQEVFDKVEKAFEKSDDRVNDILDYWDIYDCVLNDNQFYSGNSQIYVPIVADAIEARKTRFVNQIFPQSGRCVEVVTSDAADPQHMMALIEHYVDMTKLRSAVAPALMINGDVEGHWNLYVSWEDRKKFTTSRVITQTEVDGMPVPDEVEEGTPDVRNEVTIEFGPCVEVVPDTDVVVIPAAADSVDKALDMGGSVTILRRWTKEEVKRRIADGDIVEEAGEELIDSMGGTRQNPRTDAKKEHVSAAGQKEGGKYALIYETWLKIKVGKEMRLCRAYYGGSTLVLGCKLNPYWCDEVPLISAPQTKISGVFKGISKVKKVASLQYAANDWINQGADSASYGLMPIIMTDPISNPRVGSMVLDLAAVWEVDPQRTKFAEFPKLWMDALELVGAARNQIFEALGVNTSMIPGTTKKSKQTQAEVAQEQQVDMLSTADVVTALEGSILTPLIQRFVWYDMQFRDQDITVKAFGKAGVQAEMQVIPPQQMNNRYFYKWYGVEAARTAQQMQMQIAMANVLRGIPPQMYPGRRLDMVPIIERICENTFGPRLAPLIFKDMHDELSTPPEVENRMLAQGFDLAVSPLDNDQQHMAIHMQLLQVPGGDPTGNVRVHLMKHQQQMAMRQAAMAQQQMGQGGGPSGGPRAGAQPGVPRQQQHPGAVHKDQMPMAMPRKA
jgi:hypothetical protein